MKKKIKYFLGKLYCIIFKMKKYGKHIYIGIHTKIVNGRNISIGNDVNVMPYNMIVAHGNGKIELQDGVEIGMFSRIAAINKVVIEENVITGPNIFIADYNHEYKNINKSIKEQGSNYKKNENINNIIIGKDSWLGTNVVIIGDVKIGKHVVVGANSVVTKDIPDYCIAVGNPCKIIKKYDIATQQWIRL